MHQTQNQTGGGFAPKLLFKVQEAMDALSLSRTMIYRLVKRGDLQQVHIGDASRITAESVFALVERGKRKVKD